MPTGAKSSFGTLLQMGDGASPENFTTVAEVLDIAGPPMSTEEEDATNHSSPNAHEEVIPTIKRSGELTFDVNWIPTDPTHGASSGLLKAWRDRTIKNWRLIEPDAINSRKDFPGFVKSIEEANPVVGKMTASIAIRVTGQPTTPVGF